MTDGPWNDHMEYDCYKADRLGKKARIVGFFVPYHDVEGVTTPSKERFIPWKVWAW